MDHDIYVAVIFLLGTYAIIHLAESAPSNDTVFLIAETNGSKLVSIEWDLKAAKTSVAELSTVPASYSTTSTYAGFDPVKSKLYWSAGPGKLFARYIGSSPMQNNTLSLEPTDSLPFAIDDVTRLIYYAKSTESDSIYAITMDGKYVTPVVGVQDQSIRELEVDPEDGYIFWLSQIKTATMVRLLRCDITGGNTKDIAAATNLKSFTLDRAGNVIYSANGSNIWKISYSGSVISNMTFAGLLAITYAGDGILYAITNSRRVIKVDFNLNKSEYVTPPVGVLQYLMSNKGIAFYGPRTPHGSNKCTSSVHPCSHFCLPGPGQTFKCACPLDHVMLKDNKTCEQTISCKAIVTPDHSKINCYRTPDDKQFCKFQCDSGYIYHPRYNLTELFECKAAVWFPEPNVQKCLEIEKPIGVRIHGNVTFNASNPCRHLIPTNQKAVKSETITLLTATGGPLRSTCLTFNCKAATWLSCDEKTNRLRVKFFFDIEKSLDAEARLQLTNNITASFATVMQTPSKYNISVPGDAVYPLVSLTYVKLGHACQAMYEESNTGCVACPAGAHFDEVSEKCVLCPKAWYSSSPKSYRCTQCGPDQTTLSEGAASPLECMEFCKVGLFYDHPTKSCRECAIGYYQDTEGTAPCKHCGDGKTTHGKGSKLSSDCLDLCPSGHYHNNSTKSCQGCEKDTFQNKTWSYSCQRCPGGMITANKGAKAAAECILSCQVGKFFEVKKGYCERCPANHYQDTEGSTSCTPCEKNLISNVGSHSKSDCELQDQTIIIASSVGGVVVLIVLLGVSIVICKKRCKRLLPKRPQTGFETPVENGHWPPQNGIVNGGLRYEGSSYLGDYSPYEGTLRPLQSDPYTLLTPESVEARNRHERYQQGHGPFAKEPGPPSLPGERYMSPEEWTQSMLQREADRNSGVYDELHEDDDGYDKLKDKAMGPTGPDDAYLGPAAASVNGRHASPPRGAETGGEAYLEPELLAFGPEDIELNTMGSGHARY